MELLSGSNVVLATPTGSGKSLVATGAHLAALATGRVSFYTAPIKALVSEKFFALCEVFGADDVGMLTGDASVNADAPIIACTAEVLANIALREGGRADVGLVVMDEFHYYGEPDRGWAWQVPLLELTGAQFVLMSATLGDMSEIAADLSARTGRETAVVAEAERPVPLSFRWSLDPLDETVEELVTTGQAPAYVVHFTQASAVEHATRLRASGESAGSTGSTRTRSQRRSAGSASAAVRVRRRVSERPRNLRLAGSGGRGGDGGAARVAGDGEPAVRRVLRSRGRLRPGCVHVGDRAQGRRDRRADVLREVRPPFSPGATVAEFCALLAQYGVRTVFGDHYAGDWPGEQFKKHGVTYQTSDLTKSEIYRELLPFLNSARVELLDQPRLIRQLGALERRVGRSGKDSIDHPPSGHDDCVNAAAGVLVLVQGHIGDPRIAAMPQGCRLEWTFPGVSQGCFLYGGHSIPSDRPCTELCEGRRSAINLHARHLARGGTDGLREFTRAIQQKTPSLFMRVERLL